ARTAPVFHARPNCTRCGLLSDACDGRRIAQTLGRVASRCLAPRGAPVVHRSELRSRAMKFTTSVATLTALGITAALAVASPAAAGAGPENVVTPGAGTAEYKLAQGDKLRIEVYKDAQLSQSVQIRPDGKITLPLVGDLQADGRTPMQLRDIIAEQLKTYMTNPVVTVIVVETKPAVAYVTGEVNHPGAVQLQEDQITVLQALALAGG